MFAIIQSAFGVILIIQLIHLYPSIAGLKLILVKLLAATDILFIKKSLV